MPKTISEKIASKREQIQQLQNEEKRLLQKQKAEERTARTKRLCSRHGLLEKYLPDLITITDEQFEMFVKRDIATNYGRDALAKITTQGGEKTAPQTTQTSAQGNTTPAAKPIHTAQESGNSKGKTEGNGAGVSG